MRLYFLTLMVHIMVQNQSPNGFNVSDQEKTQNLEEISRECDLSDDLADLKTTKDLDVQIAAKNFPEMEYNHSQAFTIFNHSLDSRFKNVHTVLKMVWQEMFGVLKAIFAQLLQSQISHMWNITSKLFFQLLVLAISVLEDAIFPQFRYARRLHTFQESPLEFLKTVAYAIINACKNKSSEILFIVICFVMIRAWINAVKKAHSLHDAWKQKQNEKLGNLKELYAEIKSLEETVDSHASSLKAVGKHYKEMDEWMRYKKHCDYCKECEMQGRLEALRWLIHQQQWTVYEQDQYFYSMVLQHTKDFNEALYKIDNLTARLQTKCSNLEAKSEEILGLTKKHDEVRTMLKKLCRQKRRKTSGSRSCISF